MEDGRGCAGGEGGGGVDCGRRTLELVLKSGSGEELDGCTQEVGSQPRTLQAMKDDWVMFGFYTWKRVLISCVTRGQFPSIHWGILKHELS